MRHSAENPKVLLNYGGTSTTLEPTKSSDDSTVSYDQAPAISSSRFTASSEHISLHQYQKMHSSEPPPYSETRQRVQFVLNVLSQICIGFVAIYMSWLCWHLGLEKTALHAWLVTMGYSLLMAEGIMCHYGLNVLTFSYKRHTKTTLHWLLQALGGSLGSTGVLIKCFQKGFLLKSTHGIVGFIALILCLLSMLGGLSALYATRLKHLVNPLLSKTLHNLLGLFAFAAALLAQFYGYQTHFFSKQTTEDFQALMQCLTLLTLILCSIGPLQALYAKLLNVYKNFN